MPGTGNLQGTPWHVEKITRAEGDERRHRSHCVNYDKNTKHCNITHSGCWGASHCDHYCRSKPSEIKKSEDSMKKKSMSYSWKADKESIRIANFMSDLKEFTKAIKGYALKELGYTGPEIPSSLEDIKPLFGRLPVDPSAPGIPSCAF